MTRNTARVVLAWPRPDDDGQPPAAAPCSLGVGTATGCAVTGCPRAAQPACPLCALCEAARLAEIAHAYERHHEPDHVCADTLRYGMCLQV